MFIHVTQLGKLMVECDDALGAGTFLRRPPFLMHLSCLCSLNMIS